MAGSGSDEHRGGLVDVTMLREAAEGFGDVGGHRRLLGDDECLVLRQGVAGCGDHVVCSS